MGFWKRGISSALLMNIEDVIYAFVTMQIYYLVLAIMTKMYDKTREKSQQGTKLDPSQLCYLTKYIIKSKEDFEYIRNSE